MIINQQVMILNMILTNNNCTAGSFENMIGISKYLGFKKIILIGCDYLVNQNSMVIFILVTHLLENQFMMLI